MVDVPLVVRPGPPGRGQSVISMSHVPAIARRRAWSGSGVLLCAEAIAVTATTAAKRAVRKCIILPRFLR